MAKKKDKTPELQPLTDFEESLLYMSYRYAIGRHTIHSHCHAGDILKNYYERLKLTPERMAFNSKDINQSIEDTLRWGYDVYIENRNYNKNIYPYELLIKALDVEKQNNPEFDVNLYHSITIYVDANNEYGAHEIKWKDLKDKSSFRDVYMHDVAIWNSVAKCLDMSKHHKVKLTDDSIVEYVEICDGGAFIKVLIPDFIYNTSVYKIIPEESIKEYINDEEIYTEII